MLYLWRCFLLSLLLFSLQVHAENTLSLGPMPISLKYLPVPTVPGLLDGSDPIITDKNTAIVLGKALFWDANIGSDGMACASCHFHAGADSRVKNQLAPGGQSTTLSKEQLANFSVNQSLSAAQFPFYQLQNPLQESSSVSNDSHFVTGSAGTFGGEYKGVSSEKRAFEDCARSVGEVFHVGKLATRRVTPRNAPTVINAVFNYRNFWDGRANNVFNGSNSWGDRDPDAGIWVAHDSNTVTKERLHLVNASLASLATAPPLNTTEMSCSQRTLQDIGRKLLPRQPLENQRVHWNDSVLAPFSLSNEQALKPGLNTTYAALIKKAFNSKYWSYQGPNKFGSPLSGAPYQQMEANFALFFGLSIQLYESTLISDNAPFDQSRRDKDNLPIDLSAEELNGFEQFRINLCSHCHLGPNFTAAATDANATLAKSNPSVFEEISTTTNVVNRIPLFVHKKALTVFSDIGFASTGVAIEEADIGLGGIDEFGNPLSFSKQYLQFLAGMNEGVKDDAVRHVRPCDFQIPFAVNFKPTYKALSVFNIEDGVQPQQQDSKNCFLSADKNAFFPTIQAAQAELKTPDTNKMLAEVTASFKIPSLRNIELTGPYMHNGSMANLEQVIEFYSRGGNFMNDAKETTLVFPLPRLKFSEKNRHDLIAFLKTLTDDRVRYQRAPFDHPELIIPQGHDGDHLRVTPKHFNLPIAKDDFLVVPATGASGIESELQPFDAYLRKI
jgi:cytochrome c peroxidase